MDNNTNDVKELGIVRKVIDWGVVIYLIFVMGFIIKMHIKIINDIAIGWNIAYILSVLIWLFGTITLIPINLITSVFKKKYGKRWKIWRTCIVILSILVSSNLVEYIAFFVAS